MKWLVVLFLAAVSACRYAVPEARGAAPQRRPDAGPADAAVNDSQAESFGHSLIGLTRKQLLARRGTPTRKERNRWIYEPDQPGCHDVISLEVITFNGDRVARVTMERHRTTKECGVRPGVR